MECTALMLNVNYGQNKELMERCKTLKEYAQFIAIIRRNLAENMKHREAVEQAVDECIRNDILADILRKNRSEIVDSILTEWDENEYREFLKEESWKEGCEVGRNAGIEMMIQSCIEFGIDREKICEKIMEKFSMSKEDAEKYMSKY